MNELRDRTQQAFIDAWQILIKEGLDFNDSADALESLSEIERNGCPLNHQDSNGVCHYPDGDCPCFDVSEICGFENGRAYRFEGFSQ